MRGVNPVRARTARRPAAHRKQRRPGSPCAGSPGRPALIRRAGFDCLIVGAGFAGSVLAERLAAGSASACS